jgi:pimeloyl-ACP methyl ester carboxylesterase
VSGAEPTLTGGRVTSRDGTSIGYLALGEGPTVLCLHGALATGLDWLAVARLLADHYRFVLVDRRGHGASDVGVDGHTVELEIEDLDALVKHTGPVHAVLAHSFGAVIALHAMVTPLADRVGGLVIYDPPLMLDPAEARHQLATSGALVDAGEWERGVVSALQQMLLMTDQDIAALRRSSRGWAATVSMAPAVMIQAAMLAEIGRVVEPFRALELPTLLVVGELSRDVFAESIDTLAATLPNSRRLALPGQGHAALSRDPELVAAEFGAFLDGI